MFVLFISQLRIYKPSSPSNGVNALNPIEFIILFFDLLITDSQVVKCEYNFFEEFLSIILEMSPALPIGDYSRNPLSIAASNSRTEKLECLSLSFNNLNIEDCAPKIFLIDRKRNTPLGYP